MWRRHKSTVIHRFLAGCGFLMAAGMAFGQAGFGQSAPDPQQNQSVQQALSPDQLDNLVAPIALYPDPLLSQVFAASTYPLEIVEAQQWLQQHPGLRGPQLIDAVRQTRWDASVQALVAVPDALAMLNRDVQWTTDLGNAFLSQQADVMAAVQRMRAAAQQNGRLASTPQQVVSNAPQTDPQYQQAPGQAPIQIEPANPQVMYVPTYNPEYVWGPPPVGYYPPLGYPSDGSGIGFGFASLIGSMFTGMLGFGGWGWGLNWLTHSLLLNGLFLNHFGFGGGGFGGFGTAAGYSRSYGGNTVWAHNPAHRLGVPYGSAMVARQFGGNYGARTAGFNGFRSGATQTASNWRSFGSGSYQNRGAASSYNRGYSAPAQSYSRSYSSPSSASPSRSYGYNSAPSYSGSTARASSPQYSARSYASSNFSGSKYSQGSSRGQQFSAPKSSGHMPSAHVSAPHNSGGSHNSGGHSSHGSSHGGGHHH